MAQPPAKSVYRRGASSGNVSYGDPVILHESSQTQISFIPFFIPRSNRVELAIKLQTHSKAKAPAGWVLKDEKSISLKEPASRTLLSALNTHLLVAGERDDGAYLLLKISGGTTDIGTHDPAMVATALTRVLAQDDIVKHLAEAELSEELLSSLRSAIRMKEMRGAVTKLRAMLDLGENSEQRYQAWCQAHSWAFGSAYIANDDVRNITAGDNLDLLLPTALAGYRDIVELKRPDMNVIQYDSAHRNYYWSSDVSKAIGQCHRYLDVLHEVAANGLRDHPEIVAYHPRVIIVIGRSVDWEQRQLRALHGLNHRLSGVTVMTYDQLLVQGERLLEIVSGDLGMEIEDDCEDGILY